MSTLRRAVGAALLAVATAGVFTPSVNAATTGTATSTNPWHTGHTLVIPHGGGDGMYPENTLLAYEKTMAMGADVVDVDLQLTKDKVLVAFHDDSMKRTTNGTGSIRALTLADVKKLDAGFNFTIAGKQPFRGKSVTVPTLEEILKRFPTTLLSLDFKNESKEMIQPACALLTKYRRAGNTFVGSNNDAQILSFRTVCPGIPTSATMVDVYASRDARASGDPNFRPDTVVDQPPYRIGTNTLVNAEGLAWSHSHGIAILTWVVNDEKDMRHLVDIGVDGIYTSYPDKLLRVLGRPIPK